MDKHAEAWLPVTGYETEYRISSHGRVESIARTTYHPRGGTRRVGGRILQPCLDTNGYHRVQIGGRPVYVHHLVAAAFIGPRPIANDVCHNNGDRADNAVDNLRYDTRAGNLADRVRHGTFRASARKLNAALVLEIQRMIEECIPAVEIARMIGVSPTAISLIKHGHRWKHT